jgi:UTP--glucose-1-phosphate uridylyltransferase
MLPLVDARGRVRSALHCIMAEAVAAGVREIGLIVSAGQRRIIEGYLAAATKNGADDLPGKIEYMLQRRPRGFGDAVLCGSEFAGSDAFLLMLGDHLRMAEPGSPACAAQLAAAFERFGGAAMVGMQDVGPDELPRVGVARGRLIEGAVYICEDFVEKPDPASARQRLVTPGLPDGRFLAHAGIYVFTSEIFDCLRALKLSGRRSKGEIQLADAQSMLLERHPQDYRLLKIAGRAHDIGTPAGYAETFRQFSVAR